MLLLLSRTVLFFSTGIQENNEIVNAKSKIDLQPDSVVLNQLINDGVSVLYVENNNGIFTVYAIGAKPTANLTIQVTITEVD